MKIKLFIFILACIQFTWGYTQTVSLFIGEEEFLVEIADTPEKQLRGLMYRESIPKNYGMLFVFRDEQIRSFWMKNCRVHLDIIYLNAQKQIVDLHINVPPCINDPCDSIVSNLPAMYVLELRGNRAKELELKRGDSIFFILQ